MKALTLRLAVLGLGIALLSAAAEAATKRTVLRVGYASWIAAGPLLIAKKKAFFKEQGLKVELVRIDDLDVRHAALSAGRIDALIATADSLPRLRARGSKSLRYLFALNQSRGRDGLLARAEIDRVAALKGRRVAVARGSAGRFYLEVLLEEAGLTVNDLRLVDLAPDAAGRAFTEGEVDAAITSQPWLALGQAAGERLLDSTTQRPGLIADVMLAPQVTDEARLTAFKGLFAAWNNAVAFLQGNRVAASDIMARGLGGRFAKPARVLEALEGIEFLDAAGNAAYMGSPAAPGPLLRVARQAFDFWLPKAARGSRLTPANLMVQGILD